MGVAVLLSLYMLVMRFAHLSNGFQYDELYSSVTALPSLSFGFIWKNILWQDVNLPLFNVLLFGWNHLFPFTPTWMHLFSALLGAGALVAAWGCVPVSWTYLKKLIYVSLLSCSFVLVTYGPIVRTYSLSVLLSVIFSGWALRLIEQFSRGEKPTAKHWLVFFGVGLLGSYSHYFCSGLFFITALVVFLYACYYKIGRAWAFWGTAVVFAVWGLWAVKTLEFFVPSQAGGGETVQWWFGTPMAKATFETLQFLFGSLTLFQVISGVAAVALVLWAMTYKTKALLQADIILPLAQLVLLVGVVALASLKVNLWLDRYFLPLLPALFILWTGLLDYLQKNMKLFLILWPLLLFSWVQVYWTQEYIWWPEYTGLHDAFTYVTQSRQADKLLVDTRKTGYPDEALKRMLAFYLPKGYALDIMPITKENVSLSWTEKTPILLPLCSQIHMMEFMSEYRVEDDAPLLIFHHDTCIFTVHPVKDWGRKSV